MEKMTKEELDDLTTYANLTDEQLASAMQNPVGYAYITNILKKSKMSPVMSEALNIQNPKESDIVSTADRVLVKNTANAAADAVAYLQDKYPNDYFVADKNGDIFVRGQNEDQYLPLDSSAVTNLKDAADIAPDVPGVALQAIPTLLHLMPATAPVAGLVSGGIGAIEDVARQGIGMAAGVNKGFNKAQFATNTALSGLLGGLFHALPRGTAEKIAQDPKLLAKYLKDVKGVNLSELNMSEIADLAQRELSGWGTQGLGFIGRGAEKGIEALTGLPKGSAREYFMRRAKGTATQVPTTLRESDVTAPAAEKSLEVLKQAGKDMLSPVERAVSESGQRFDQLEAGMSNELVDVRNLKKMVQEKMAATLERMKSAQNKDVYRKRYKALQELNQSFGEADALTVDEMLNTKKHFETKIKERTLKKGADDIKSSVFKQFMPGINNSLEKTLPGRKALGAEHASVLEMMGITAANLMESPKGRTMISEPNVMRLATASGDLGVDKVKSTIMKSVNALDATDAEKRAIIGKVREGLQSARDIAIADPKLAQTINAASGAAPEMVANKFTTGAALSKAVPFFRGLGAANQFINPDVELQGPLRYALQGVAPKIGTQRGLSEIFRDMLEKKDESLNPAWDMEQEAKYKKMMGE